MKIDFLITTLKLNKEQIIEKVQNSGLFGNVIVGNQQAADDEITKFNLGEINLTIVNQTGQGVSINRNRIFQFAQSDFVTFLDDDTKVLNKKILIESLNEYRVYNAIRFNCISNNLERPIRQINKNTKVKFAKLRTYGVWGIAFKREFLIKNLLKFDETLGPGCYCNHGEDSLFIKEFLKKNKFIYQVKEPVFSVDQITSTWIDNDYKRFFISQGYAYGKIFNKRALISGIFYVIRHRNVFPEISCFKKYKLIKQGIIMSKK